MPTGVYEEKHKNPKMSYQDPPPKKIKTFKMIF